MMSRWAETVNSDQSERALQKFGWTLVSMGIAKSFMCYVAESNFRDEHGCFIAVDKQLNISIMSVDGVLYDEEIQVY